jgi:hypothetical protein
VRGPYGQLLLVFKCLCMSPMADGSKTIKRKKNRGHGRRRECEGSVAKGVEDRRGSTSPPGPAWGHGEKLGSARIFLF